MRKKAPPKIENQQEWFVASLTPAALSIFSDSFYPSPSKRTGEMKVFVAVNKHVKENPSTINIRVMSGFNPKTLRVLSGFIAEKCLDIKRKVTKPEFEKIKEVLEAK